MILLVLRGFGWQYRSQESLGIIHFLSLCLYYLYSEDLVGIVGILRIWLVLLVFLGFGWYYWYSEDLVGVIGIMRIWLVFLVMRGFGWYY